MFIYKIKTTLINQTYLYGFTIALNELLKNHPEWSYLILNKAQAACKLTHLTLIDLTNYENVREITDEEKMLIQQKNGYKNLVLLRGEQSALAYTLQKFYTCSMLCVDELHLHIRELIESSLKKHRFTSTMTIKMIARHTQPYKDIKFTAAEMRILSGLYLGKNGVELSDELSRSQKTISSHKRRIMEKLGVKDDLSLMLTMKEFDYIKNNIQA